MAGFAGVWLWGATNSAHRRMTQNARRSMRSTRARFKRPRHAIQRRTEVRCVDPMGRTLTSARPSSGRWHSEPKATCLAGPVQAVTDRHFAICAALTIIGTSSAVSTALIPIARLAQHPARSHSLKARAVAIP